MRLLDHVGLCGFPVHSVSWQRVYRLDLLLIGAWIVKRSILRSRIMNLLHCNATCRAFAR